MTGMTTVRGVLLHERAADEIRASIYRGDIAAGERINEVLVAEELGLSRGPIREALRVLEQEGVVTSEPQKGVRVAAYTEADILLSLQLREHVETFSVPAICERVTDDDIAELRGLVERMRFAEQRDDLLETMECDYLFHVRFLEVGASATAQRVWRTLASQIRLFISRGDEEFRRHRSIADTHLPLIDALARRDVTALIDAVRAHIDENRRSLHISG
ncbi:GntR family transcriptional regulator [Microbacterium sp. Root553]|uniref:GntR family transcriptional regulator n=1 Tax=Microbacterium sp. Root553 TaxID=1736556 RepID=UPI000A7A8BA6|nr:GntR family transcriptional regulator [Microbacterium sp. Root553]